MVGKGTFQTYGIPTKYQMELYAKAPAQRSVVVHNLAEANLVDTFDGKDAWISQSAELAPLTTMDRTDGDVDAQRLLAALMFPAQIKTLLTEWRTGGPATVDDRDLTMVQGTMNGKFPVNLYFEDATGLLVRTVTYADSPVGFTPFQVDYSDYRDVDGVKIPFKEIITWLDGKSIIMLSDVKANVPVDASKFARSAK